MINLKVLYRLALTLLCLSVSIANAEMSSVSFRIPTAVLSSGGNTMSSTNFTMVSTLGQSSPTGRTSGTNYNNNSGFLFTLLYTIAVGDANGDGIVNLEDVILALQVVTGQTVDSIYQEADADGDGKIGLIEAIIVLKKLSN